eukprot:XP_001708312.1 Hypothetical protein GL50803_114903 [Giardia lamblia ATCC 50803]
MRSSYLLYTRSYFVLELRHLCSVSFVLTRQGRILSHKELAFGTGRSLFAGMQI